MNLFEPDESSAQVATPDGAAPVWNTLLGCWHVKLAPKPLPESSKPQEAGLDRLDKWRVIIRNDSDRGNSDADHLRSGTATRHYRIHADAL